MWDHHVGPKGLRRVAMWAHHPQGSGWGLGEMPVSKGEGRSGPSHLSTPGVRESVKLQKEASPAWLGQRTPDAAGQYWQAEKQQQLQKLKP